MQLILGNYITLQQPHKTIQINLESAIEHLMIIFVECYNKKEPREHAKNILDHFLFGLTRHNTDGQTKSEDDQHLQDAVSHLITFLNYTRSKDLYNFLNELIKLNKKYNSSKSGESSYNKRFLYELGTIKDGPNSNVVFLNINKVYKDIQNIFSKEVRCPTEISVIPDLKTFHKL
ncbi:hypothetical protein CL657_04695 [bacterium]|nr:hypothetical protein [bacterium]